MDFSVQLQLLLQIMQGYYNTLKTKLVNIHSALNSHVQDTDNPHQLDKSHIGLDQVQNLPVSTEAEAEEGESNASYMTPVRVKQAIEAIGTTDLDQVENLPLATQVQAEEGESNEAYMTPLRTAQAIEVQVIDELTDLFNSAADDLE